MLLLLLFSYIKGVLRECLDMESGPSEAIPEKSAPVVGVAIAAGLPVQENNKDDSLSPIVVGALNALPQSFRGNVEESFRKNCVLSEADVHGLTSEQWQALVPQIGVRNRLQRAISSRAQGVTSIELPGMDEVDKGHGPESAVALLNCRCIALVFLVCLLIALVAAVVLFANLHVGMIGTRSCVLNVVHTPTAMSNTVSLGTNTPVFATFINRSPKTITVYWRNFQRNLTFYARISPQAKWGIQTYPHHWWLVYADLPESEKDLAESKTPQIAFAFDAKAGRRSFSVEIVSNPAGTQWNARLLPSDNPEDTTCCLTC